jgi:diguanylate cyclase (GGDEF)-like protein
MNAEFESILMRDARAEPIGLPDTAEDWPVGLARCARDGAILALNAAGADILRRFGPDPVLSNLFAQLRAVAPQLRPRLGVLGARGGRIALRLRAGSEAAGLTVILRDGVLTAVLTDETPLLRAERDAQRHRARFAAFADAPRNGAAFTIGADGRVTGWSESARRFEGVSTTAALGQRLSDILARTSLPVDLATLIEAATRAGEAQVCGVRATQGRATMRLSLTLRAVRDATGGIDGFVVILREDGEPGAGAAELRMLADTDPLTRVLNRRGFEEAAEAALQSAAARGEACALILVDLDNLKAINDAYGHGAGDVALKALSEALRDASREGDIVGRLGGDEFAVLTPGADLDRATQSAWRLCVAARRLHPVSGGVILRVSASIGVAANDEERSLAELMLRADAALYRAKSAGRDRVMRG